MLLLDAEAVRARLPWPAVLAELAAAFDDPGRFRTPERVVLPAPDGGALLTMPCADDAGWFGVKQVAVLPSNPGRGLPSVRAWYTLMDPGGAAVLACDATHLTRQRTAGVSALAAERLVAEGARTLLLVGTGGLAPWMARAHLQVRRYRTVWVWGRDAARAAAAADRLRVALAEEPATAGPAPPPEVRVADDLERAVRAADVVSVATTSVAPLIRGAWLRPGQHLDLVGAFREGMAEADAEAVAASDVFVDDRDAARAEAGDLLLAAEHGWSFDAIRGDLHDVRAGAAAVGAGPTLFKSVGLAFEDLVLARLLAAAG
jgi:ornithine cyclodeaminase